jgi:hypothetical protein
VGDYAGLRGRKNGPTQEGEKEKRIRSVEGF